MTDSVGITDFVILATGVAGGYFVSRHFHRKQSIESNTSHAELVSKLDGIYEQALRNGIRQAGVLESVRKVNEEVAGLSDLIEIKEKMEESVTAISRSRVEDNSWIDEVLRYKALGDRWSELVADQLTLRILSNSGALSKARLLSVHKELFPDNFPWAGRFRNQHVWVIDTYGTAARIVDQAQAETKMKPIDHDKIETNLDRLFGHWNSIIGSLAGQAAKVKVDEIANFHHDFEIIHPFLDGNGRIGRMLVEEQLSFLFKLPISFKAERQDYYRAMRMMDMGDKKPFIDLLCTELERFNVAH
ncbi:MAG TPA: Fic family protein [Kangiella sp.]